MGTPTEEFNVIQFEKRLTALKDSQDHINACCKWCLENRLHHKKIVTSWLNVLKRVKIEQRVNLFYLANDVIQYSKRKHYEFVDSWGTALQKATTLVRDEKVKHKIIRIFNIWQQRGVYNEEFIADLCGLISVVPTASKNDEPHEFQPSYVVNKIKQCAKLENETDLKLKVLKEHNPKIQIETESLCTSLKDRVHVDDVEKELETYVKHLEGYINALKAEIKCRITNISVLKQANTHLDKDKRDVKVVANAYKVFGNKIKTFQKRLEEHRRTLISPIPSPDINAPSPSPDCDIELPDDNEHKSVDYNPATQFTAGYYNPVPPPSTESAPNFVTNGYTSFIGSSFNMQNLNTSTLFTNTQTTSANNSLTEVTNSGYGSNVLPPPPIEAPVETPNFQYQAGGHLPLLPPPMPPFNTKVDYENSYGQSYNNDKNNYASSYNSTDGNFNPTIYEPPFNNSNVIDYPGTSFDAADVSNPYHSTSEEYNPEQEPDTWEADGSWSQPLDTDTPESPPNFEKEGYVEGVEYHDTVATTGASDVDHRVLHPVVTDIDIRGRGKDVDHRNLISLTGSPAETTTNNSTQSDVWSQSSVDQDYRVNSQSQIDQDYRMPPFNIEQLKLPPPPPPPPKALMGAIFHKKASPRKMQDNVESIDMDLSEDETEEHRAAAHDMMLTSSLKPPPPFPDLPDDIDANSFLDDLNNDLNSNDFTANLHDPDAVNFSMSQPPPHLPFPQSMTNMPPPPLNNWGSKPQNNFVNYRGRGGNRGGGNGGFNNRGNPRGRGRGGNFGFRGGNSFRGRGMNRGGAVRPHKTRGNRGNYQGGF